MVNKCPSFKRGYECFTVASKAAKAIARILRNNDKTTVGVYRCKQCGSWHIGTELQNKNPYKRDRRHIEAEEDVSD